MASGAMGSRVRMPGQANRGIGFASAIKNAKNTRSTDGNEAIVSDIAKAQEELKSSTMTKKQKTKGVL